VPIYTRHGDKGETALYTPKGAARRVPKDDPRVDAYGTVDELNALIGLLRSMLQGAYPDEALDQELRGIQERLFHVGYDLSTPIDPAPQSVTKEDPTQLEAAIDRMTEQLPPLRSFILPSGSRTAAICHLARTVCRRAERRVVALGREVAINPQALTYLNRLSDYLFTLARTLAQGGEETFQWRL
jgi:cob(I)alamin adenosyltransferase